MGYVKNCHGYSERRACKLVGQARRVYRYRSVRDPRLALRSRMREIATTRVRYGYRRIRVLLNREGWRVGQCVVRRIYREEGLTLRKRPPRRREMIVHRQARFRPTAANKAWSLDFVLDKLGNSSKFRALTVVDVFTREALAISVGQRMRGEDVVATLDRLIEDRGKPRVVFTDNGSKFSGRIMDLWAYDHGVRIDFSRPCKPTDNAFVETFNGSLRDECLNVYWFATLAEARATIEAWRPNTMRAGLTWLSETSRRRNLPARRALRRSQRASRSRKLALDPGTKAEAPHSAPSFQKSMVRKNRPGRLDNASILQYL